MFTMAKIKNGGTYLSQHLTANDYYCENETVGGQWVGRGAEKLNLHGEIKAGDAAFEKLRNNRHPDGSGKLTPRDGNDRVKFFDFQCSAQKSISVMAVTMGDTRLLAAHDAAAVLAFGELERFAALQRGRGGLPAYGIAGARPAGAYPFCDRQCDLGPPYKVLAGANGIRDGLGDPIRRESLSKRDGAVLLGPRV